MAAKKENGESSENRHHFPHTSITRSGHFVPLTGQILPRGHCLHCPPTGACKTSLVSIHTADWSNPTPTQPIAILGLLFWNYSGTVCKSKRTHLYAFSLFSAIAANGCISRLSTRPGCLVHPYLAAKKGSGSRIRGPGLPHAFIKGFLGMPNITQKLSYWDVGFWGLG